MVPGAIGLVVGGGPLTQYASPTTMFVPSRAAMLARIPFYLRMNTTDIVSFCEQIRFATKSEFRSRGG